MPPHQQLLLADPDSFGNSQRINPIVMPQSSEEEHYNGASSIKTKKRASAVVTPEQQQTIAVGCCCCAIFLAVLIGTLTGLLINALSGSDDQSYSTAPPRPLPVDPTTGNKLSWLPDNTIRVIIADATSPQARAWEWLQDHPDYDYDRMPNWRKHQLFALSSFFYATGGDTVWSENNWSGNNYNECGWERVTCNSDLRCTSLIFHNEKLRGSLPAEIGLMDSLEHLHIWDTSLDPKGLTGSTIPSELGDLTALTHLALVNNRLGGELPSQLGNLESLQYLALEMNELVGRLPTQLGNMDSLTWLSLWGNQFWGALPVELWGLSDLQHMFVYKNRFTGTLPRDELNSMTALISLGLAENQLKGQLPKELGAMTSMTWLSLQGNEFNGVIPNQLGRLTDLTWLSLSDNLLQGQIPTELGLLTSLYWLSLQNNRLKGRIPDELGDIIGLEAINLSFNRITGVVPMVICTRKPQFVLVDCQNVICSRECPDQCGCA